MFGRGSAGTREGVGAGLTVGPSRELVASTSKWHKHAEMHLRVRMLPLALVLACRTTAEEPLPRATPGVPPTTTVAVGRPAPDPERAQPGEPNAKPVEPEPEPESRVSTTRYTPASTLPEPIAVYRSTLPRPIFAERSVAAPLRGRIEMQASFNVYALHEGENDDGCSLPWAQVGEAAWICSKHTAVEEHGKPHTLPVLPGDKLLPFLYARHVRHEDRSTPKIPVYRHLAALRSGADPVEWLGAYGTYAFVRRARSSGSSVLIDVRGRVMPGAEMRTFEPTEFAGRDLDAMPVPADRTLAWVVHRDTGVYAEPDPESEQLSPLAYHAELLVEPPEPEIGESGKNRAGWIRVPAGDGLASAGWIPAAHIRSWRPQPPPEPVLTGQLLIDVDLDQQVLTLWHEDRPIFATLIASGKPGYSTPVGLYRIITKRAYGKMASLPSEPEPYWVDAVPWTMYFDGRFALHGAFWHDRFGYRTSHGCINLAPRDAKLVFDRITPTVLPGWLIANEHVSDPGTLVRIHKGDPAVPDRRSAKLEASALDD